MTEAALSATPSNAWIVRAGRNGEAEASNLELGRATIAWDEVPDLTGVTTREQLQHIVDGIYPDASAQSRGNMVGQIWAFRDAIKPDDLVVLPMKSHKGQVALGRCVGSYGYDASADADARHFLPVTWQPTLVSRDALKPDLEAIVNGALTVFRAESYDAAARLDAIAAGSADPGFGGVSDGTNEPVRHGRMVRTALAVLADASGPLPRSEVMRQVGERLTFTPYEAEQFRPGDSQTRWQNHLAWWSTDMRAAGWIEKTPAGWQVTDAGRAALSGASEDGSNLSVRAIGASRRRTSGASGRATGHYAPVLDAALEFLEPGQWTSYSDLASVASTNAQTVGSYVGNSTHAGAHRVIGKGGRPVPGFVWADGREGTQREALEDEGVEFDSSGVATEAQHVRTEDLRAYLEELDILKPPPRRAWLVRGSSVDGHDLVPTWRREGFASLRGAKLREVEAGISRQDLKPVIDEDYSQTSYAAKAAKLDEFHAFLSRMQLDDVVATTSQGNLYVGTVTGDAEYLKSPDGLSNLRRTVDWVQHGQDYGDLPSEIKARLQVQYDVVEMTQQLDLLEAMLEPAVSAEEEPAPKAAHRPLVLPDATDELASSLHVDRSWLQECIDLLRDRPQLIFYGPPGTGKTYIAQHLAAHLAGDNVRLVQFHPAYSYEDFFEGYRPLEAGGLALKPGPLRKTVDAARENPSTPYFLIIDEINRGNLAKIFGELYFLLEYRSQNVDLLYATDDDIGFTLPENVFVIGTMNTADRSIALVDAAMRRRFAFVPLHPSEEPTRDVLRRWLTASNLDSGVADLLDALNARIEDPDFKIGPSYLMRPAVHEPGGLDRAWRTAILPLLEEHHFGDGTPIKARYGLDALRSVVAKASPSEEPASDAGPADPA